MTTAIPGMKVKGPRTDLEEWAQLSHWADVGHPFLLAQKREAQPGGGGSDFISTESVRSHFYGKLSIVKGQFHMLPKEVTPREKQTIPSIPRTSQ